MKRAIGVILALFGICLLALPAATRTAHAGAAQQPPTITKVTIDGNVSSPGGEVEYRITVTNPASNTSPVSLDCIIDVLPDGFTYQPDSSDPYEPGNCEADLGWYFDGKDLNPGESQIITFTADVDEEQGTGCYYNEAAAFFDDDTDSVETGPTAVAEVVDDDEEPTGCGTTTVTPPAVVRTATPTTTATPEATSTSPATAVPATVAPEAPTATPPGGGAGGVIVGPNTGTGGASTTSASALAAAIVALSLLAAGSIALAGAGSALRRRR